jgi:photosynthetic reaction center H subunit
MKEHEKDRTRNRTSDDVYTHNMHGTNRLVRLKDLTDFKIAKGDPDVRGWTVNTSDNIEVGKVDELIVDTAAMKVRYLVVDLYDDYAADKIDHYLLLPIGAARLHEKDNTVMVSGIRTTTILNYPVYRNNEITRDYEYSVRSYFDGGGRAPSSGAMGGMRSDTMSDQNHLRGNVSSSDTAGSPNVHGTSYRHDIESSHMQNPDRLDDTTRTDTDSLRGDRVIGDRREVTGEKDFGTPNFTTGADFHDRTRTSGLTPRTGSLENKEINEGPSGTADRGEWNETSNLNSSTSLSNEPKRGSNQGNLENRQQATDRDRAARSTDDDFYTHDHFDEEVFYRVRRKNTDD